MHDPQVYGWEVADLDPECLTNDPDDAEELAIIEEFQRQAEAA